MERIAELKAQVGIEDLIAYYAPGVLSVSSWRNKHYIACPFHDDRNPSAVVDGERQTFACYSASCGIHGDILDVVIEVEGLEGVREAIEWIEQNLLQGSQGGSSILTGTPEGISTDEG